ncbi:glyoxylate/hydroxypyruvate reductase A [Pokkaliibacter sp. MBI-7]|uniref:2-hydroxyacid dehydrogenase n=1 Tax=Pokkaliibacter sp. MBI-7 TaxID=3040600 RepID=UPI0024470684|nr:glyoxylate/hydroxypyruvate reductase A [Pokkaliibacter sp. MBI-7]MDH2433367.1 glyoxylate/hydroxypyruvate reductase A [Pokkaliibacter sp. MBI-7]
MLYLYVDSDREIWQESLQLKLPLDVVAWPHSVDAEQVEYVAAWNPPDGFFAPFTHLKGIFALGAGLDRFHKRDDIAPGTPLIRLTDAGMAQQMLEYVLHGILHFQRDFDRYLQQQEQNIWQSWPYRSARELRVSVLGLGELGGHVAQVLAQLGYQVQGWSRTPKHLEGITTCHGMAALPNLLQHTDVLVSILPSTPETRGLLNADTLILLPRGAVVINAGRGDLIELRALIDQLDSGHLRGAQLDVFPQEPLTAENPIWQHPKLIITPHVAAATLVEEATSQIASKLAQWQQGQSVAGLVTKAAV